MSLAKQAGTTARWLSATYHHDRVERANAMVTSVSARGTEVAEGTAVAYLAGAKTDKVQRNDEIPPTSTSSDRVTTAARP